MPVALHQPSHLTLAPLPTRAPQRGPTPPSHGVDPPSQAGFGHAEVHGLRNPLAGVRATVQLAQLQSKAAPEVSSLLDDALAEVDRLDARIRALLTLHQPEAPKPRPLDLADLLENVARALESRCAAHDISLRWRVDVQLRSIEADPDLLEEALLELGQNALNASSQGSSLSFLATGRPGCLEIHVRDTAGGIAPAIQSRIFEPFFTTRPSGTGLGLPTLRRRIEQAGGTLDLESSAKTGSCFRIRLPHRR